MRFINNRHNWSSDQFPGVNNPLGDLRHPSESIDYSNRNFDERNAFEVHVFSNSHPEIMHIGEDFLQTSTIPSRSTYRNTTGKSDLDYVKEKLVPVFDDLIKRLKEGEWNYQGQNEEESKTRGVDINNLIVYINILREKYLNNPTEVACEELVWMHDILRNRSPTQLYNHEGEPAGFESQFIIMFANIKDNLRSYVRDTSSADVNSIDTSCTEGIQERLIIDAATISGKLSSDQEIETSMIAMQSYIREYLNRFILENNEVSSVCLNLLTLHMASRIREQRMTPLNDVSHSEQMGSLYDDVFADFQQSLSGYMTALGMPWLCSKFEYKFEHQLKGNLIGRVERLGFFAEYLSGDADYNSDDDLDIATQTLRLSIRDALINRFILQTPPKGCRSWFEFNTKSQEYKDYLLLPPVAGNNWRNFDPEQYREYKVELDEELHLEIIAKKVNTVMQNLRKLDIFSNHQSVFPDVNGIDVVANLQGRYYEREVNPSLSDFKDVNKDMCVWYLDKAVDLYSPTSSTVLSCFDSRDLTERSYEKIIDLINNGGGATLKDLSNDMIIALINKSLEKNDGVVNRIFPNTPLFLLSVFVDHTELALKIIQRQDFSKNNLMERFENIGGVTGFPLLLAVEFGNNELLAAMLNRTCCDKDVLFQSRSDGITALSAAVQEDNNDALQQILNHRCCDRDIIYHSGMGRRSPLNIATERKNAFAVRELLNHRACGIDALLQSDHQGDNSLLTSIIFEQEEIAEIIITSDKCTNDVLQHCNKDGENALMLAITYRLENIVQLILKNPYFEKSLLLQKDSLGLLPLLAATENKQSKIVLMILDNDACDEEVLMQKDSYGYNVLLRAVDNNLNEVALKILKSDACTSRVLLDTDRNHNSILLLAVLNCNYYLVEAILKHNWFDPNLLRIKDLRGYSPLMLAVKLNEAKIVDTILNHFERDHLGVIQQMADVSEAFALARESSFFEVAKLIIDHAAVPSELLLEPNKDGFSLLTSAALSGNIELARLIVETPKCSKEVLMQQDRNGLTPLMFAIHNQAIDIVRLIIHSRAFDTDVLMQKNYGGKSAMDLLHDLNLDEMIEEIQGMGYFASGSNFHKHRPIQSDGLVSHASPTLKRSRSTLEFQHNESSMSGENANSDETNDGADVDGRKDKKGRKS